MMTPDTERTIPLALVAEWHSARAEWSLAIERVEDRLGEVLARLEDEELTERVDKTWADYGRAATAWERAAAALIQAALTS